MASVTIAGASPVFLIPKLKFFLKLRAASTCFRESKRSQKVNLFALAARCASSIESRLGLARL